MLKPQKLLKIGFCPPKLLDKHNQPYDAIARPWYDFLLSCALMPILLPNNIILLNHMLNANLCDGFLLSGGGNFSPNPNHDTLRETCEKAIITHAINTNKPLIGVCRGMQAINMYFQGSLQHIQGHTNVQHSITMTNSNALAGGDTRQVNSYHDYAIDMLGNNLNILAQSHDGVIEAFSHASKPILGIMWHPERTMPYHTADTAMFNNFYAKGSL